MKIDFNKLIDNQISSQINREISNNIFSEMFNGKENLKQTNPRYFFDEPSEKSSWRTDRPPMNVDIELLCVLFDEDNYRELKSDSWGDWKDYNRTILKGHWSGTTFVADYSHSSGDPWYQVVAWKEIDYGEVLNIVSALWVGICLTCFVNGIINLIKYEE